MDMHAVRESASLQFLIGIISLSIAVGFHFGLTYGLGVFGLVNTAVGIAEYWKATFTK